MRELKFHSFRCVVLMTLSFLLLGLPGEAECGEPLVLDPTEFSERQFALREWYQDYQQRDDATFSGEQRGRGVSGGVLNTNYGSQLKSEESVSSSVSVRPGSGKGTGSAIENGWIPITKARFPAVNSQKFQPNEAKPVLRNQPTPTVNSGYTAPVNHQSPPPAVNQKRPQKTHSSEVWNELQNKFNLIDQKSQQEQQALQQQWREQELKREQMEVQQIILALEQSKQKLLPQVQQSQIQQHVQQPQFQPQVQQQQQQPQLPQHYGSQQQQPQIQQPHGIQQQQPQNLQRPLRPKKRPNKFRRPPKEPLVNFRPPPLNQPGRGKGLKPILQKQRNKIRQLLRPRRRKPNKQQQQNQLNNFQQQVKQQHNNLQQTLQQSQHQNNMMSQPSQQYGNVVLPPQQPPQQQYGTPQQPPQQQYGAPQQPPQQQYGASQQQYNNAQQQQPLQQLQQQYNALSAQQVGYNVHQRVQEIQQKAYDSILLPTQPLKPLQNPYSSPLPPINLPLQQLQHPHPLQPFQGQTTVFRPEIKNPEFPEPTIPVKLQLEPLPSPHAEIELTSPPEVQHEHQHHHHHQEGPVLLGVTTKICVEEQIGPTRIFEVKTIRTGKICKVKVKRFSHCPQGETYITMDDNSSGACTGINNMLNFGKLMKEGAGQLYNLGLLGSEYAVNALGTIVDFYSHSEKKWKEIPRPEIHVKLNVKH